MAIEENKVTLVGVNSASVTFSNEANVEKTIQGECECKRIKR